MANSFATPEPLTNINLDQDLLGDVDSRTVAYISIYRKITQPEFYSQTPLLLREC